MHPITVFVLTLIAGPGMFWVLCKTIYRKTKERKYPEYLVDGVGDIVFIPLFNAVAVYFGIQWLHYQLAFILAFLVTTAWGFYRVYFERTFDWTVPKHGTLNFGGWYHLLWFLTESFIIISVLLESYNNFWIWIPLVGYLLTSIYSYSFQVHKNKYVLKKKSN